jgi:hypothetical protein
MSDRYTKDPSALLDYYWDWGPWLARVSDTISSATVTLSGGLTQEGPPVFGDTLVTQRVSGGTVGVTGRMVCRITTAGGLVEVKSIYLSIVEK